MKNTTELTKLLAAAYAVAADILKAQANAYFAPDLYDTIQPRAAGMFAQLRRVEDEYHKDAHDTTEAKRALKSLLDIFERIQEAEQMYFKPKTLQRT